MKKFQSFITEIKSQLPIVVTFGRFNPPTLGHALVMNQVLEVARKKNAEHRIYTSQSQDAEKNPLTHAQKIFYLKKFFPAMNINGDPRIKSFWNIFKTLSTEGYKDITIVVGSDRLEEIKSILDKYGKKDYGFTSYDLVVAGATRSDNKKGVAGISASKVRAYVRAGDFEGFKSCLPVTATASLVKKLYADVRKGMMILKETWIFEVASTAYPIVKNPARNQISEYALDAVQRSGFKQKNQQYYVRGMVTKNGDLYICNPYWDTHGDIFDVIRNEYGIKYDGDLDAEFVYIVERKSGKLAMLSALFENDRRYNKSWVDYPGVKKVLKKYGMEILSKSEADSVRNQAI